MRLLFVTEMPFWLRCSGAYARDYALVDWLSRRAEVTVLHVAPLTGPAVAALSAFDLPVRMRWVDRSRPAPTARRFAAVRALVNDTTFDACIVDRLEQAYVRDAVSSRTPVVLDTHDLASVRDAFMVEHGHRSRPALDFGDELAQLARFDAVLMIQPEDHARVARHLGDRAILAMHPVTLRRQPLADRVETIGLAASRWIANQHGMAWFLDGVWPRLRETTDVRLRVMGSLGPRLTHPVVQCDPRIEVAGVVPDLVDVYRSLDLAINPVKWGSGLKIKTVEAMGAGVPLVTTREGARGLGSVVGRALLVADEPDRFADHIEALVRAPELRRRVADAGVRWVRQNLSPDACFGPLWRRLVQLTGGS